MQTMAFAKRIGLLIVCLSLLLSLGWVQPVAAQGEEPLPPGLPGRLPGGLSQPGDENYPTSGPVYAPTEPGAEESVVLDTGGPDYYGYTWNDSVAYSWVNASGGSVASLSNSNSQNYGPVTLPFAFKYYENTYTNLYISKYGHLDFYNSYNYTSWQYLPDPQEPNTIIAPYWGQTYLTSSSRVYYRAFGSAPNRTFVVQWNQVKGGDPSDLYGGNDTFTYQVILYENGNIKFQYQTMDYVINGQYTYWCAGTGIEDMRGIDGLSYKKCGHFEPGDAVLFTRPAPASRVLLETNHFGAFASLGGSAEITLPMQNTGEIGAEVYDLEFSCGWPVTFTQNGSVLTDTDFSGWPNTSSVAQGAWITLEAHLQAPAVGNVGDHVMCLLGVVPMQNAAKKFNVQLDAAIPAPFAQVYTDYGSGGVALDINEPGIKATFQQNVYGYYATVAEAPNGNLVYAWSAGRSINNNYVYELFYAIRGSSGNVVKAPTRLVDLSSLGYYAYDEGPSIAVAPDGTIGIAWYRYQSTPSGNNYNIHFARLNAAGTRLGSIVNVTNYTTFAGWDAYNFNRTYDPVIAATGDNNFLIAWLQEYNTSSGWVDNIRIAGYSTGGAQVRSPINITSDTAGSAEGFDDPRVTAVGGNKVMVVYRRWSDDDLYFQVRSSSGGVAQAATELTNDNSASYEYAPDLVELSNGNILIAWRAEEITYVVLNPNYSQVAAPQTLDGQGDNISVAADRNGHGIIQFGSNDEDHIWYALVNSSGTTLTPPVVSTYSGNGFFLSYTGGAITSHSMAPSSANTDLYLDGSTAKAVVPESPAFVQVSLGNLGAATTSTVTVTLEKPAGVSLWSFNPAPQCVGDTCTWSFNSLAFLGSGKLSFLAIIPASPVGSEYLLEMVISAPETDDDLSNNELDIRLVAAEPLYLPAAMK